MFITRVELHGGTSSDYQTLHAAMEGTGFSRSISASDGHSYNLPFAEYYIRGEYTVEEVRDCAKRVADSTGRQAAVLTSRAVNVGWTGLTRAV